MSALAFMATLGETTWVKASTTVEQEIFRDIVQASLEVRPPEPGSDSNLLTPREYLPIIENAIAQVFREGERPVPTLRPLAITIAHEARKILTSQTPDESVAASTAFRKLKATDQEREEFQRIAAIERESRYRIPA